MAKRDGFRRFAASVQYHGGSFLGFPYLGNKYENCILSDGTDLTGYLSVEGRLRIAFTNLFGENLFENIQVSSRTDRGVHAVMNTMHFDVSDKLHITKSQSITQAINDHLAKTAPSQNEKLLLGPRRRIKGDSQVLQGGHYCRSSFAHDLRVLKVLPAPLSMPNPQGYDRGQPATIDWNARYSATERSYIYRVLCNRRNQEEKVAFEWDRAWCIYDPQPFACDLMQSAGNVLTGTHDFSSFRAARCQRSSPIVSVEEVDVSSNPYIMFGDPSNDDVSVITIKVRAKSFLYHQVRNMVGCLVAVGRGKMTVAEVKNFLQSRSNSGSPGRAPAHGLYLVHVGHTGIEF